MNINDMAREIRQIVINATNDLGPDLLGYSVIDLCMDNLCMDNITKGSTADIKAALVIAGVDHILSERLVKTYSR